MRNNLIPIPLITDSYLQGPIRRLAEFVLREHTHGIVVISKPGDFTPIIPFLTLLATKLLIKTSSSETET